MKLTSISVIKELMGENDAVFKKKYGQNFLINEAVPQRIAESVPEMSPLNILEIGPGIGTLTCELAERADRVLAVEIDETLIPILARTLEDYKNVSVVNADIMKCDTAALCREHFGGEPFAVCANLPYYITTPILMSLLEGGGEDGAGKPRSITVMVQREVADRLCAPPADPLYGAVTASVAWYGHAEKLFTVPAGCFMPAPKVDSAVVRITLHQTPPADVCDERTVKRVIRGAFAQRRKTLVNSIACEFGELTKTELAEAIVKSGISPTARGETLGIEQYATLSNVIFEAIFQKKQSMK